ncbi:DivIVA domain-containing protein [Heliorestis acidaminivorans]|uniref:DivIVA domain-containing protein n=1 Tax=Heliorestis acidaminivorans TaxID=553427 RepID=A0A6I0FAI3_9FIRM|nr:DivIVA domain-containing protein [Heliorestis acidaminivorans]KAB2954498.1 DivIVA domain-containing protein [Heliorestis acidaminivorans]
MLTPLEIHQKEFKKSAWGYKPEEIDTFLERIAQDYEALYKENMILKEQIARGEENLHRYRQLEDTLNNTLLLAQKTADEVRITAERESELLLKEARHQSEIIISNAKSKQRELEQDFERLKNQSRQFRVQFRAMLLSQLEAIKGEEEKELDKYEQNYVDYEARDVEEYEGLPGNFQEVEGIAYAETASAFEGSPELSGSDNKKAVY